MHALKRGLNADKFTTFSMFLKRFYHSLVFQMTLILYTLEATERKYTYTISKLMKTCESG